MRLTYIGGVPVNWMAIPVVIILGYFVFGWGKDEKEPGKIVKIMDDGPGWVEPPPPRGKIPGGVDAFHVLASSMDHEDDAGSTKTRIGKAYLTLMEVCHDAIAFIREPNFAYQKKEECLDSFRQAVAHRDTFQAEHDKQDDSVVHTQMSLELWLRYFEQVESLLLREGILVQWQVARAEALAGMDKLEGRGPLFPAVPEGIEPDDFDSLVGTLNAD